MSYLQKFIHFHNTFARTENDNVELEIKLILDPRNTYPKFIKTHGIDDAISISKGLFQYFSKNLILKQNTETIDFISTKTGHKLIKELCFKDGIQIKENKKIYSKTILHAPLYLCKGDTYGLKLCMNLESPIFEEPSTFNLVRFKNRFRFIMENWYIDFTFVKSTEFVELSMLKSIKEKFFKHGLDKINSTIAAHATSAPTSPGGIDYWKYADRIEIEFELSTRFLLIGMIQNIYDILKISTGNSTDNVMTSEQNILYKLNTLIHKNSGKTYIKDTLKKVLPNAIEINKRQYFEEILPNITSFYITDKADGIRTILIISDAIYSYNSGGYKKIRSLNYREPGVKNYTNAILECENIEDKYYVYDVIEYNNINASREPFAKRLEYMGFIEHSININSDIIKFKKFMRLPHQRAIKEFYEEKREYEIDGIIFTSADSIYKNTLFYKWKPSHLMSIDFVAKRCPNQLLGINPFISKPGKELYFLFVGVSSNDFKRLKLRHVSHYNKLFSYIDRKYFPTVFSPSDFPNAYLFWHESGDLDGCVVELTYAGEWKLLRIRTDRSQDLIKDNYYGNNFKIAEIIWRNYANPLTLDLLCSSTDVISADFYFIKVNSKIHEPIRKFNNMVKDELLKRINYTNKWIIDLGCGSGQDMFKYLNMCVDNVLFVDSNNNNLCEIIRRKYTIKDKNMGVFVQRLDLNEHYSSNLKILQDSGIPIIKSEVQLIVCNFAIHYFVHTHDSISNFVKFVDASLASGGRFMITYMDGKKIFDTLKLGKWGDGKKYRIEADFVSEKFTGVNQNINILLPFSDGKLYRESLVNIDLLEKKFKAKKFTLESTSCFDIYLNTFMTARSDLYKFLDDIDRKYIEFLRFAIFYKK